MCASLPEHERLVPYCERPVMNRRAFSARRAASPSSAPCRPSLRQHYVVDRLFNQAILVSGVGTGSIGALQKLVVAGVLRDLKRMRWADELRTVLYELEELLPGSPADFKFRT